MNSNTFPSFRESAPEQDLLVDTPQPPNFSEAGFVSARFRPSLIVLTEAYPYKCGVNEKYKYIGLL